MNLEPVRIGVHSFRHFLSRDDQAIEETVVNAPPLNGRRDGGGMGEYTNLGIRDRTAWVPLKILSAAKVIDKPLHHNNSFRPS